MSATVLVALSEEVLRAATAEVLRAAGYAVRVPEPDEALGKACRRESPDLIALAPDDPRLDEVRADRELPYIPVLLVSLRNRPDERAAGLRAGADDFIGIDAEQSELTARVDALAKLAEIAAPAGSSREEVPDAAYLSQRLRIEYERAGRLGEPLSLLLLSTRPAPTPESLAAKLARVYRRTDPVARAENAELAILLRNTHFAGAVVAAQRVLSVLVDGEGDPRCKGVQVGVGCYPSQGTESADDLLELAQGALRRAREDGRERVYVIQNEAFEA